jgi:Ca2+/Na+ antiporter
MSLAEMTVLGMVNCVTVGSAAFALCIVVGIATIIEPIKLEITILYIDDEVIDNRFLRMLLAFDINRVIILKNTRVGLQFSFLSHF